MGTWSQDNTLNNPLETTVNDLLGSGESWSAHVVCRAFLFLNPWFGLGSPWFAPRIRVVFAISVISVNPALNSLFVAV